MRLVNAGRITNLDRPVVGGEVIFEVHSRLVDAVYDEHWEPGSDFLDHGRLPASQGCIDRTAPAAANRLPLAEGQVVDDASGELLV